MCACKCVCNTQTTNVTFSRRDPLLFHLFDLGSPLLPSFAVPNSNNTTYTQISHPALTCWHLPCTEVSGLLYVFSEVEVFIVFFYGTLCINWCMCDSSLPPIVYVIIV